MSVTVEALIFENYSNFSNDLLKCRLVCKRWNQQIIKSPPVKEKLFKYSLSNLLWYDKKEYDKNSVHRQIIAQELLSTWDGYHTDIIPGIEFLQDDLDYEKPIGASECITAIIPKKLPHEFLTFLNVYREFPNNKIRLYPIEFMVTIADSQFHEIRNILRDTGDVQDLIFINPLCYSKHYKSSLNDKQYINVLCYINYINNSYDEERFFVLVLELNDLQNMESHKKHLIAEINHIVQNVRSNIEYLDDLDVQTFLRTIKILFKQQLFNM